MSCANCRTPSDVLRKCTRCESVVYCSEKCQRDDWERNDGAAHRHVCAHIGIRLGPSSEDSDANPSVDTLRAYIRRMPGVAVMGAPLAEYISNTIDEMLRGMLVTAHANAESLVNATATDVDIGRVAKSVAEMRAIVDTVRRIDGAARRRSLGDLLQVRGVMARLYGDVDDGRVLALLRQEMLRGAFVPGRTFVFAVDKWTFGYNGNNGRLVATVDGAPSAHQADPAEALAAIIPGAAMLPYPESGMEAKRVQIPVDGGMMATIDLSYRNGLTPLDIPGGPCVRIATLDNDETWPPLRADELIMPLSMASPPVLARRAGVAAGEVRHAPLFDRGAAIALVGPRAATNAAQAIATDLREAARSVKNAVYNVMMESVSRQARHLPPFAQGIHIGGFVERAGGALDDLQRMVDAQRSDATGGIPRMLALPRITEAVYSTQPLPVVNTIRSLLLDGRWSIDHTYVFRDDDSGELLGRLDGVVVAGFELLKLFPNARVFAMAHIMQLGDGYQIDMNLRPADIYDAGVVIWRATPAPARA